MYIFVLFKQPPYVDEVRFDNRHVNGGQAWRRNNRVKEVIQKQSIAGTRRGQLHASGRGRSEETVGGVGEDGRRRRDALRV